MFIKMWWCRAVLVSCLALVGAFPFPLQNNDTNVLSGPTIPWDLDPVYKLLDRLDKRDVPANMQFCSGTNLQLYTEAYADVVAALAQASTSTQSLLNYLNTNPGSGKNAGLTKQERLLLYTFQVIFGQVLFEGNQNSQNQAGVGRVQTILNVINTIGNAMSSTISNVEIHCDENWLQPTDPFGNGPSNNDPTIGFSSSAQLWVPKGCQRSNGLMAYAYNYQNPTTGVAASAVTFCPGYLGNWLQHQQTASWRQLHTQTYANGQVSLNDFKQSYLGETLAHEFSHVHAILGNNILVDNGYNWLGVTTVAVQNPSQAINNADSFAYYIIALYFNNNSWLTGYSQFIF